MTAILLLTKNEENTIGKLIDEIHSVLKNLPEINARLFLCDDSTDQTADIARRKGVEIIKGKGCGLGWSYYFALYTLSRLDVFENIITIDGDGQTDLSELPLFYKELSKGYNLIVGSRFLEEESISYPYARINFLGVKLLSWIITLSTFQRFTDSHGGLRVMKSSVAKKLKFLGTHSYVQETIITAKEQGFKIKELPSKWNRRMFGESRVVHSKWKYLKNMIGPLFLRMRLHYLFLVLALFLYVLFYNIFYMSLYMGLTVLFILAEVYKTRIYQKNSKEIKKGINDG